MKAFGRAWFLSAAAVAFLLGTAASQAASSIDTTQPVQGVPFDAAPIRQNFQNAANDINALQSLNAGNSAPSAPSLGTLWLDTSTSPTYRLKVWVPSANTWITISALNSASGQWEPMIGGGTLPSIISGATTDLGTVPNATAYITGNQSIASFGSTTPAGQMKFLVFTGTPTLVQNATYMILPGAANLQMAPNEAAIALALGAGKWRVLFVSGAAGAGIISISGDNGVTAVPDPIVGIGSVGLTPMVTNTVKGNATSGTAVPTDLAVPSCADTGGNHLNWITNTGFACGTGGSGVSSITATAPIVVTPSPIVNTGIISMLGCGSTTVAFTNCDEEFTIHQRFGTVDGRLGNVSSGNQGAPISGTTYTLDSGSQSDCGRLLVFTSSSPVTVTVDDTAPINCNYGLMQLGTGLVTISTLGTTSTLVSRLNGTQTAGQYAFLGLFVYANSDGSHALLDMVGDYQ